MLRTGADSDGCEAVLGYRGNLSRSALRRPSGLPLSPPRLAQGTRTKALFKLIFIYTDGARYADHAVGWDLALPNP